jgi:penicillin-binding protein 1A
VRRQLIDQYGENAENGPNSVYAGGLWVRTSLDQNCRRRRRMPCAAGCCAIRRAGWHGPIAHIDMDREHWQRS